MEEFIALPNVFSCACDGQTMAVISPIPIWVLYDNHESSQNEKAHAILTDTHNLFFIAFGLLQLFDRGKYQIRPKSIPENWIAQWSEMKGGNSTPTNDHNVENSRSWRAKIMEI